MSIPLLLPTPRKLTLDGGNYTLPENGLILASAQLLFEAQTAQAALGIRSEIVAHSGSAPTMLTLALDDALTPVQSYRLQIMRDGITILAPDAAGIYYGVCTLRQLVELHGRDLPCLRIHDHPDFPARGIMLDISRDKVPTMETLYLLIEKLAAWKINEIQLYTEHTFAFRAHPAVWTDATPLTGQEVLELDAFCKLRHIDLVPNMNSLGHMERWLKHKQYLHLAETPEGFTPPWGGFSEPTTLNPLDPGSVELVASLYAELLPHFSSPKFNIGGDEPWELGQGKSKAAVAERGGRVYLDYLLKLYERVKAHGRTMQFWGDIIVHYPDLVPELPKDIVAMEWGYEGNHDFDGHGKLFGGSGIPFYVCPGTSSWNSLVGRTDNMVENQRNAAVNGLKHGAVGYLNTDWGDNGHWQHLSISYAGLAVGAAFSWCYDSNKDLDLPAILNTFVFKDRAGIMGQLVVDLGNIYKLIGPEHINGQELAIVIRDKPEKTLRRIDEFASQGSNEPNISPENLRLVIAKIDEIIEPLNQTQMLIPDGSIVVEEFQQGAEMLKHGALWLLLIQGEKDNTPGALLEEWEELADYQRNIWLSRNRPGGLEDSLKRFDVLREAYKNL